MKRYDDQILNTLIDKYERSTLYDGSNRVRITIAFPVSRQTLPDYFDETSLSFDTIHTQLREIEEKGFITLQWRKGREGHILEKVLLRPEAVPEIYRYLHRTPRGQKEAAIIAACEPFREMHPCLANIADYVNFQLSQGASIKSVADPDHPEAFSRVLTLAAAILTNHRDCFLREFSVRTFHDSKTAERDISAACTLIRRFSGNESLRNLDNEDLLSEFGIYKNPVWILAKGSGRFFVRRDPADTVGEETIEAGEANKTQERESTAGIDISVLPGGIGIAGSDVPDIVWDTSVNITEVLTIENLTTFHRSTAGPGTLCIYLGGYASPARRAFLKSLATAFPNAHFCHFGDIDCGGFLIWKALCLGCDIPFEPYKMDLTTYKSHLGEGRLLTASDRKQLTTMLADPFFQEQQSLFLHMLETGLKLEQEAIL